jgi:hypothetical protein
MLKTIHVPGFGPYVCGRLKSQWSADVPRFSVSARTQTFQDVNAIRAAAKSLLPIYGAVENILANDTIGDCADAGALKMQAIFDCASGKAQWREPSLADAKWLYSQTTTPPYDPITNANDNGSQLETVLSFWASHGLYSDGHGKIKAAFSVDATNKGEVIAALETNGLLYAGVDLAKGWDQISGSGFVWGMNGPPDPNAGHCVFIYGFNSVGVFVSTWGFEGTIPWSVFAYYFGAKNGGEVYTVVSAT